MNYKIRNYICLYCNRGIGKLKTIRHNSYDIYYGHCAKCNVKYPYFNTRDAFSGIWFPQLSNLYIEFFVLSGENIYYKSTVDDEGIHYIDFRTEIVKLDWVLTDLYRLLNLRLFL